MRAEVERSSGDAGMTGSAPPGAGAGQEPARIRTRTKVWIVVAAVVFSAATAEIFGRRYSFFDMRIYHGAVEWWTSGRELYEFAAPDSLLGFTYPPFAALTMLPMALMSSTVAGWVNLVASVVALAVVLAMLLVPVADRLGWPRGLVVAAALPLALALEPNRETIGFGQVNLLLFLLVMADLLALRWRANPPAAAGRAPTWINGVAVETLRRFWYSGAWAGAGIGLATAIKVTPGLFILYLLVSRQWKPAAVATGTAAGASLFGFVFAPRESFAYFTSVLWQTDRVGAADFTPNQSLAGILARLYDQPQTPTMLWLSFGAVCCALGLMRAVNAHREGDELAAFTLVGLTAIVISPISWTHHLVFVVPAIVILGDLALRRRAAGNVLGHGGSLTGLRHGSAAVGTYLLFLMAPIWWVRHRLPEGSHYDSGLWGVLAENSLALGVILLVAAMPWRPGAEPAFPSARRPARPARSIMS
jgi:alpha-1,2-mannosyltransferase